MPNPTVARIDAAIAELRAQLADWPAQASEATITTEHFKLIVDRDARLIELELHAGAKQRGLVSLGEQICAAQWRCLDAFAAGHGDDEVELGGEPRPVADLPHTPGLPLLPPIPTQTDLDRTAAAFDALLARQAQLTPDQPLRAASELVNLEMATSGRLVHIDFTQRAHEATIQELADDLLATAARARTEADETEPQA